MNSKAYKCCAVPLCESTTIKTPSKLFIYVPTKEEMREKWLKVARRDPVNLSANSSIYFCEDHFDLPNDMENYMQYHVMGSVSKVRIKPDCVPTKFECQPDIRKRKSSSKKQPIKKQRMKIKTFKESQNEQGSSLLTIQTTRPEELSSGSLNFQGIEEKPEKVVKSADKSFQTNIKCKFRSKAVQTGTNVVSQGMSTMKTLCRSVATSPFKYAFQDSHTSDLDTKDDNNDDDEDENHETNILLEEIDVKPKLECLEHNTKNGTPPPDLKPSQLIFDDEFDYFGKNVAEQLRTLPLFVALETQEMLLSVLKKQQLNVLPETFRSLDPLSKN